MRGIIEPVSPPSAQTPPPPLLSRIGWFLGLAASGVVVTAVVAYGLRALLFVR